MNLDLSRRRDGELLREFHGLVEKDRASTSEMLAYIGEIQARKLFVAAGYSSMYKYCVRHLHMSQDMAYKRTRAARLARRFPVILDMIADGRLHLSGLVLLAPRYMEQDFPKLLEASSHKTRAEMETMLAYRFPQPDAPTMILPLVASAPCQKLAPGPVVILSGADESAPAPCAHPESESEPAVLPVAVMSPELRPRLAPVAPQRFALQVTLAQATHDKLRRAQDLLGHKVLAGDLARVLDLAFDALLRQLERDKFAATEKPRTTKARDTAGKRHVPAKVQRAVWERDGCQCTFVSESGHRCDERRDLELDHVVPFARGGEATVAGLRLRCRPHNQLEAERMFGAGFMARKRGKSRDHSTAIDSRTG